MNPLKWKRKKEKAKAAARITIQKYFEQASSQFKKDPSKAHATTKKLRTLAMKHRIRLPPQINRRVCKHCYHFLVPGINLRVRTRSKHRQVIYYCLDCKKYRKFVYYKPKKANASSKE